MTRDILRTFVVTLVLAAGAFTVIAAIAFTLHQRLTP